MNLIILGAPGAGKGTQAKIIAHNHGIPHISTGDIFRENIKNNTELGKEAKVYIEAGSLVPDHLACELIVERVTHSDCKEGFVLDGFPRTIPQAEELEVILDEIGKHVDFAIDVEVPDDNIIHRIGGRRSCPECGSVYHIETAPPKEAGICDKCGHELVIREDDKPETVQKRLSVYHAQTKPIIDFYDHEHILKMVDGTKDIKEVTAEIEAILEA